ncbi:unnamed protein product, partial [Mesorhabditis spiculigera]
MLQVSSSPSKAAQICSAAKTEKVGRSPKKSASSDPRSPQKSFKNSNQLPLVHQPMSLCDASIPKIDDVPEIAEIHC